MTYGQWCSIQFGLLSLLGLGILVHVMLHWTWVCSVISRRLMHQKELPMMEFEPSTVLSFDRNPVNVCGCYCCRDVLYL